VVEGKGSRSARVGEAAVGAESGGGEPGGGEHGVGSEAIVEVVTDVPPASALIHGEVPALPTPAAVEGGEVLPTLPVSTVVVTGKVLPALPLLASAKDDGLAAPGSLALLSEAPVTCSKFCFVVVLNFENAVANWVCVCVSRNVSDIDSVQQEIRNLSTLYSLYRNLKDELLIGIHFKLWTS
jgi:hypothetical protein